MPKKSRGAHLNWRADRETWEIIVYERGRRKRISTGTSSRPEAEKQLAEFLLDRRPVNAPRDPSQRIIGNVLADYAQERGQFLKSQKTLINCMTELTAFWGDRACADVREETCRLYCKFRNDQYKKRQKAKKSGKDGEVKPSVIARELSVLSAAIQHDYKAGRLTLPVPVWKPKFDNRKDRWLTRSEVAALLRAARKNPRARGYLPLFILLGIYTAARHSAILSLKWSQVDLDAGLLDLHTKGEERTNKGKALIPIPKRLMTFLRHAKRKGTPNGYVVHENQRGFLSVKKTFGEACKLAGLEGVSPHTMRHSSASWMAQRRVPFPLIARFLGHTDSRITERIYSHHNPDYLNAAAEALDNRPITATTKLERDMTKPKLRLVTGS
jgi:integrase